MVLKVLAPEVLASALIGKGGAVIAQIRQSTQAKIALSNHSQFFPGTDCRVVTASGDSEDCLNDFVRIFTDKIIECSQVENAPVDSVGTPEQLKLRTVMPKIAVGGIIGKGGAAIKQLRESSGAQIRVADGFSSGPGSEQIVTITGSAKALEYVIQEVITQVQKLNQEAWFRDWAHNNGTVWAEATTRNYDSGGGYGGGSNSNWSGYSASYSNEYSGPPSRSSRGGDRATLAPVVRAGFNGSQVDMIVGVARELPSFVMEDSRGFAMSCVVPNKFVGGLIGRGGANTKEVQTRTGTTIAIREDLDDPESKRMNISGPLGSVCAAYMLMMNKYLDVEAEAPAGPVYQDGKGSRGGRTR
jgi:transcription antitermination factor NusA-like protein